MESIKVEARHHQTEDKPIKIRSQHHQDKGQKYKKETARSPLRKIRHRD